MSSINKSLTNSTSVSKQVNLKDFIDSLSNANMKNKLQVASEQNVINRIKMILVVGAIRQYLQNHFFVAVIGQKDCGKSTLISEIIKKHGDEQDVYRIITGYGSEAETVTINPYYLSKVNIYSKTKSVPTRSSLILLDFPGSDGLNTDDFFQMFILLLMDFLLLLMVQLLTLKNQDLMLLYLDYQNQ